MSINTKTLVLLVMICVQIARKVTINMLTEALIQSNHIAIGVSLQQNSNPHRPPPQNPNACANLGRNPLVKEQIQLTEWLLRQELT